MDKRFSKRTAVNLTARIIANGKSFEGAIENVSEGGIGYLINSSIKDSTDFKPTHKIEISFLTSSGENMDLECEIAWFSKPMTGTSDLALGLKIVNPPSEYKDWITHLTGSSIIRKIK